MKDCYAEGGKVADDGDIAMKRKKRLQGILGAAHFALGGMAEDAQSQMKDMDMDEDMSLSDEDKDSAVEPEDPKVKAKARLFALMAPKFKKK